MSTKESKTRTITLTNRQPVRIRDDDWKVIADASGDSYGSTDYGRYQQALHNGECDTYVIKVRQHNDGRTLVYGIFDAATAWTHNESKRGGELLTPPEGAVIKDDEWYVWDEIPRAIRRVGDSCNLPDSIISECIADLPAQEL